jgi:BirA family biotin operon repressor/biotin-[acetyl-CoA-carboxylase] ligase
MIGSNIQFLPEVDSTNNYIAKLISEGKAPHGTVILAEKQTAGRGQRGNVWQTTAKNQFTGSFYLVTAFLSVRHASYLNKALTLAVAKSISAVSGENVKIKWPNDILVNDLKLGGILIEGNIKNQVLEHVVLGLGLNLEQEVDLPSSTSLEKLGVSMKPFELLTFLLPRLQEEFERCRSGLFNEIQREYLEYLWRLNEVQMIRHTDGSSFLGKIVDVNEEGSIVIDTESGLLEFGLQEVKFSY